MSFYRRHLPHWQPNQAEFFITFRLAGSLPRKAIERLKRHRTQLEDQNDPEAKIRIQKEIFQKYEQLLNGAEIGPTWLRQNEIASIVVDSIHFYDESKYDLYAYCVMPNHVHLVFRFLDQTDNSDEKYRVTKILHSIKSYTALECNKVLERSGPFWQPESYDRVIRDQDELENIIRYTLNNPVKAGFVERWRAWPHSYCKPEFVETFM
jgi:REP element-mobilizing transposase RayT